MSDITLFGPKNEKDLKRQYPELGEYKEFAGLTSSELLFSWYYANPTSPLVKDDTLSDKQRAIGAVNAAMPKLSQDAKEAYFSLNFPDNVKRAVDRWRKFDPTVRARAKAIVEMALENMEKLVKVDLNDFIEYDDNGNKQTNWTGRNSYINSVAKMSDTLPQLIAQVESGFGVVTTKGEESKGLKAIDRYHTTIKD